MSWKGKHLTHYPAIPATRRQGSPVTVRRVHAWRKHCGEREKPSHPLRCSPRYSFSPAIHLRARCWPRSSRCPVSKRCSPRPPRAPRTRLAACNPRSSSSIATLVTRHDASSRLKRMADLSSCSHRGVERPRFDGSPRVTVCRTSRCRSRGWISVTSCVPPRVFRTTGDRPSSALDRCCSGART